jgi:hypothetical protein
MEIAEAMAAKEFRRGGFALRPLRIFFASFALKSF